MVEAEFEHWGRLLFRADLIEHPDVAREYDTLKKNSLKPFMVTAWPTRRPRKTLSGELLKKPINTVEKLKIYKPSLVKKKPRLLFANHAFR
jgi:hypothetical protein